MNRPRIALTAVIAAFVVSAASAQERVVITYTAGYPSPDRSASAAKVKIVRYAAPFQQREVEVDRFFGGVRKILSEYQVHSKWNFVQPDSAYVRMVIHLSEGEWELASSLPPVRAAETLSIDKMDTQVRHQVAFEKVRRLAHEYLQQRTQHKEVGMPNTAMDSDTYSAPLRVTRAGGAATPSSARLNGDVRPQDRSWLPLGRVA